MTTSDGAEFAGIRQALGLSQAGLAVLLGRGAISRPVISKWERGANAIPPEALILARLARDSADARLMLGVNTLVLKYPAGRSGSPPRGPQRAAEGRIDPEGSPGSESIEVSPEMVKAGEMVLDRACEVAEIWPPSYQVLSAAADVYTAMEIARRQEAERAA